MMTSDGNPSGVAPGRDVDREMAGMMLPSAGPMLLLYGDRSPRGGGAHRITGLRDGGGYLPCGGFSLIGRGQRS